MPGDVVLKARVTGRVQGVWFRGWTRQTAEALGLSGWVRNEPNGSVSALSAGPEAAVADMVAALHHGPEFARVDRVVTEEVADDVPEGFRVLR